MQEYLILISRAGANYCAYCPDVDGVIATGDTIAEATLNMQEALQMHVDGTVEDGDTVPAPNSIPAFVSVNVPQNALAPSDAA